MRVNRFQLRRLAAIYAGGAIGALARVGLAGATSNGAGEWPWATFAVNIAGALLLGWLFARLADHPEDSVAHPILTTGICGTLTTFSTLQLELFEMIEGGDLGLAAAYVAATLGLGFLAVRLGIALERQPVVAKGEGRMSPVAWIAVGTLGGAAAAARFLIDAHVTARAEHPFPLGILAINLCGALVLGLVAGAALEGQALVIVAGGGIGSFTTFSTWILDSHRLAEAGHTQLVWLNLGLSLVAGFAAVALGHWMGQQL
jgi:CrcB protein